MALPHQIKAKPKLRTLAKGCEAPLKCCNEFRRRGMLELFLLESSTIMLESSKKMLESSKKMLDSSMLDSSMHLWESSSK